MGISLKDIFNNDEEKLIKDRHKIAIRNMIIFSLIIAVLLVATIAFKLYGNQDTTRRVALTQDMQSIRSAVMSRTNANSNEEYLGVSLEDNPATLVINGYNEEYRYGYYYLASGDLKELVTVLNMPNEEYFVNYDTGDVVSRKGAKYKKKTYHSYDDIIAIYNNQPIPSDSVIIINTADDLEKIRQRPTGYFKLSGNIDMNKYSSDDGWKPINAFNGVLDGRGYTISNLTINRPTQKNIGLFEELQGKANISNLKLENFSVVGGEYTGALAGYCSGRITNVHLKDGIVKGTRRFAGALIGAFAISNINNCTITDVNVTSDSEAGGVIGALYSGNISRVSFEGNVTAETSQGGGLVGLAKVSGSGDTKISESVARANVSGKNNLGGFVGNIDITSDDTISIVNSYSVGKIEKGDSNVGGMIGYIYSAQGTPTITLENLYADVEIVNKMRTAGGFIGKSGVGNGTTKNTIECYWKRELAPGEELSSTGDAEPGSDFTSKPKSAEELMMRKNYTDWDFSKIWDIDERKSTAFLRWETNYKTEDKDVNKK